MTCIYYRDMSKKAKNMEEEEIKEVETQSVKEKKPKKVKSAKKQKKIKRKEGKKINAKSFFRAIWMGILFVLKVLWKILKFFLKYILFPFWYTGVLFVKTYKFLRFRSKDPLTEEDKKFLSLIPTLFFMMAICIIIVYLLFYLDSVYGYFDLTKQYLSDSKFWAAIGGWFADIGVGIYIYILSPIGRFIRDDIVKNFSELLGSHQWVGALIILAILVVGTGLLVLIINFARKGKIFHVIRNFFVKIKNGIVRGHDAVRKFVLKYLIGEKYIETRSKNFFWTNVFLQILVTLIFLVFSIWLVVQYYLIDQLWVRVDIMRYASFAAAILFAGVGIFATWFFNIVHGISTSPLKKTN